MSLPPWALARWTRLLPSLALILTPACLAADDGRSIARAIGGIALLVFGPLIAAIVLGFVQLGVYRLLVAAGWLARDRIPIFPVLLMRGLLLMLALIALGAFYLKFVERRPNWIESERPAGS